MNPNGITETYIPIFQPHLVQKQFELLTLSIPSSKSPTNLVSPLHGRLVRTIENKEEQDGVLQEFKDLEEQCPDERIQPALWNRFCVKDPETKDNRY